MRDCKPEPHTGRRDDTAVTAAIREGLEDLRAGRVKLAEEVLSRLEEKYREKA